MRKLITLLTLLLLASVASSQDWQYYYYGQTLVNPFTASFSGFSGTYSLPQSNWLYFDGRDFMRTLADDTCQYFLKGINASTDSFKVIDSSYNITTNRPQYGYQTGGAQGWRKTVGMANGTNHVEWYIQGIGSTTSTILVDTGWHEHKMIYRKSNTQLQLFFDGTRTVNNTSATSTIAVDTNAYFCWGYFNGGKTANDTSGTTSPCFNGGLKYWEYHMYSGGIDSCLILKFDGWGQEIFVELWVDGVLKFSRYDVDRSNYTGALPYSLHIYNGFSEFDNRRQVTWGNSMPYYTFISPLGTGVQFWDSTASNNIQKEAFGNGEALFVHNDTPYAVIGGRLNNANGGMDVLGTEANYIARYNLITGVWSNFGTTNKLNGTVTSICQWGTKMLIAGNFTGISGVPLTNGVAQYDWETETWSHLDSGVNGNAGFIAVINDTPFVGGGFTLSGSTSLVRAGRLINGEWRGFGTGFSNSVNTITTYNNELYFGGTFVTANGVTVNGLAKWTGSTFTGFGHGVKTATGNGGLYTMMVYGNRLHIGGRFDSLNSVPCNNYIVYNGSSFTDIGGCTLGNNVLDLAVLDQYIDPVHNVLAIVGQFSRWNGVDAFGGVIWNGSTFVVMPPNEKRPEGIRITTDARWIMFGDPLHAYSRRDSTSAIFEIIPTFTR